MPFASHQEGEEISAQNSRGQTLILMGDDERGSGGFQTKNNKGHTLVALGTNLAGEGTIITENGKGETASTMP